MKRALFGIIACIGLTAGSAPAANYQPTGPIERKYSADGPWATTTAVTSDACDRKGDVCDIWYPTDLGSNRISGAVGGFRHPVIVFANGTALTVPAEKNAFFLRHLASWGFIVIRSRDGATGQGETVIDTANYIIGLGRKSGNIFEGKVDAENVGLTGHSQGGATAVLLFSRGNSPFKTFVPIETPIRPFCAIANCLIDPGALPRVSQGSIFYVGGGMDLVSSEPTNLGYYLPTADRVDKVLGIVANGSHTEIEGDPTCAGATKGTCNIGVYPLLGFPTAWFMWKLQNASDGPDAFAADGELSHAAPNWVGVRSDIR